LAGKSERKTEKMAALMAQFGKDASLAGDPAGEGGGLEQA
jgi:hypothetical protein